MQGFQQQVGTIWGIATISGVVVLMPPCAWFSSSALQGDRDRKIRAQPSCQAPASSAGLCLRMEPCFSPLLRWLFLLQLLMTDLRSVHTVPSLPPWHRATWNRGHCTALPKLATTGRTLGRGHGYCQPQALPPLVSREGAGQSGPAFLLRASSPRGLSPGPSRV